MDPQPSRPTSQFAHFYRSLEAYKATLSKKSDVMVVDPSGSEFFKVLRDGQASNPSSSRRWRWIRVNPAAIACCRTRTPHGE
jgi:hypothetical protein